MLLTFLFSVLCALFQITAVNAARSSGCGKAVPSGLTRGGVGQSNKVLFKTSSGTHRDFLLHIPTNYNINTATPVIFSFHGRMQTAKISEATTRFSDETWNPNHLVVYPDGLLAQWQGDPDAKGYNDTGFVLEILDSLSDEFCLDTSRIYSSGHSNGAGFSLSILACDPVASTKFAAFVGSAPAAYQGANDRNCNGGSVPITCSPGRKNVPILSTHGTDDEVIPYEGGPRRGRCLPSAAHFSTAWAERNGLTTPNISTVLYDGKVRQQRFRVGTEGVLGKVVHYWIKGFNHNWPTTSNGGQFDLTPVAMKYFNRFTLTSDAGPDGVAISRDTVISKSATASVSTPNCPASDGKVFASGGGKYTIRCAYDSTGKTLKAATYPGSFVKCIQQCDALSGCLSVSYNGACYLKGAAGSLVIKSSQVNRVAIKVT